MQVPKKKLREREREREHMQDPQFDKRSALEEVFPR